MSDYFENVVRKLTIEDVRILSWLLAEDATAAFKAIKRSSVFEGINLSATSFRKTLSKLEAINFIGMVTNAKEHKLYLTQFGQRAVTKATEEVEGV